jgi:hypothetical protein
VPVEEAWDGQASLPRPRGHHAPAPLCRDDSTPGSRHTGGGWGEGEGSRARRYPGVAYRDDKAREIEIFAGSRGRPAATH